MKYYNTFDHIKYFDIDTATVIIGMTIDTFTKYQQNEIFDK